MISISDDHTNVEELGALLSLMTEESKFCVTIIKNPTDQQASDAIKNHVTNLKKNSNNAGLLYAYTPHKKTILHKCKQDILFV